MMAWSMDTDDFTDKCYDGTFPVLRTLVTELQKPLDLPTAVINDSTIDTVTDPTSLATKSQTAAKFNGKVSKNNALTTKNPNKEMARATKANDKQASKRNSLKQRIVKPKIEGNSKQTGGGKAPKRQMPQRRRPPQKRRQQGQNAQKQHTTKQAKSVTQAPTHTDNLKTELPTTRDIPNEQDIKTKLTSEQITVTDKTKSLTTPGVPRDTAKIKPSQAKGTLGAETKIANTTHTKKVVQPTVTKLPQVLKNKANSQTPRNGIKGRNGRRRLTPQQIQRRKQFLKMRRMKIMKQKQQAKLKTASETSTVKP